MRSVRRVPVLPERRLQSPCAAGCAWEAVHRPRHCGLLASHGGGGTAAPGVRASPSACRFTEPGPFLGRPCAADGSESRPCPGRSCAAHALRTPAAADTGRNRSPNGPFLGRPCAADGSESRPCPGRSCAAHALRTPAGTVLRTVRCPCAGGAATARPCAAACRMPYAACSSAAPPTTDNRQLHSSCRRTGRIPHNQ